MIVQIGLFQNGVYGGLYSRWNEAKTVRVCITIKGYFPEINKGFSLLTAARNGS